MSSPFVNNYPKVTVPNLQPKEQGYKLDTGDLVAVSFRPLQNFGPAQVGYIIRARWVDANGAAINDANGKPLVWEHVFACYQAAVASGQWSAASLLATAVQACLDGDPSPARETPPTHTDHPDGGVRAAIITHKAMIAAAGV